MIRTIMASAATIALTMGVAVGQGLPPATGLTPGAPVGADPYSGEGVVAGETSTGVRGDVRIERPTDPALTVDEPAMAAPVVAEPVVGEAVIAEPVPEQDVVVSAAPGATVAGEEFGPSPIGLTPGAPLGSDPVSDQKLVAGEAFRTGNAGILLR